MKLVIITLSIIIAFGPAYANSDGPEHNYKHNYECTAEKPTSGILNKEGLANFHIKDSQYTLIESATIGYKNTILLSVEHGGCTHYGLVLTFVFNDKTPAENKIYYKQKAAELLEQVPFKKEVASWKGDFLEAFAKNKGNNEARDTGIYPLSEGYTTIYLDTVHKGHTVTLNLLLDIAL